MRILLTGGTGMLGQGVLQTCLADAGVSAVTILGRRATGRSDPRLREVLVEDFMQLASVESRLSPFDACFYCAGALPFLTPEAEYRHVTLDLTTHVARTLARLNPKLRFLYVSGAHADPRSRLMPMRVKGETEAALALLQSDSSMRATSLRPGGIQPSLGERSPHRAMAAFHVVAAPLMGIGLQLAPALLISTANVGKAMLRLARDRNPPAVVENADINRLAEASAER